jgi:hypothetical protein
VKGLLFLCLYCYEGDGGNWEGYMITCICKGDSMVFSFLFGKGGLLLLLFGCSACLLAESVRGDGIGYVR